MHAAANRDEQAAAHPSVRRIRRVLKQKFGTEQTLSWHLAWLHGVGADLPAGWCGQELASATAACAEAGPVRSMTADFEWSARSPIGLDTLDLTGSRIIAVDDVAPLAGASEPATLASASSRSDSAIESSSEEQPAWSRASRPRPRAAAVAGLCALSALCGSAATYQWGEAAASAFAVSIAPSSLVPSPLRRSMDRLGDGLIAEVRRLAVWPDTPGETAVAAPTPSGARETTLMMNPSRKSTSVTDEAPERAPVDGGSRSLTPAGVEQRKQIPPARSASLNVNASPWADVWVDGVFVGQTPLGNVRLRDGRHHVRFSHPELGERTIVASIQAGTVAHVTVDFGQPDRQ